MNTTNSDINALRPKKDLEEDLEKSELQKEMDFYPSTCPSNYNLLSYIELLRESHLRKGKDKVLTAMEASELVLKSTSSEVPVIVFSQLCFLALKTIPPSEETKLVNLVIAELRDNAELQISFNELEKMTDLVKSLRTTFFPSLSPKDCINRISEILIGENESIFDYIARFLLLHLIILEYYVTTDESDFPPKYVIEKIEKKHKTYFLRGIELRYTNIWSFNCITYYTLENYIKAIAIKFEELRLKEVTLIKKRKLWFNKTQQTICFFCGNYNHIEENCLDFKMRKQLLAKANVINKKESFTKFNSCRFDNLIKNAVQKTIKLNLSDDNPLFHTISTSTMDEHTRKIGMLKAKEASEVIPYFDGSEPPVFDFIKTCYIALSNILIDEHEELVRITISRLKGKAAECVKWIIITEMIELIRFLIIEFDHDPIDYLYNKVQDIYLKPTESFCDYIDRFKRLHSFQLHHEIIHEITTHMKTLISLLETKHLVEFIKGFYNTPFILDSICYGFNDTIEKITEKYKNMERNKEDEKQVFGKFVTFSNSDRRLFTHDECIILHLFKDDSRVINGSYHMYLSEPYLTQLRNATRY